LRGVFVVVVGFWGVMIVAGESDIVEGRRIGVGAFLYRGESTN